MRAVIDTTVYISALLSNRGSSAWMIALWKESRFEVVISLTLFNEIIKVLAKPEIVSRIDTSRRLALLRRLRFDTIWTPGTLETDDKLSDPEDNFLQSSAVESKAEFIVTWDKRLLEQGTCQGIFIVSPDQFTSLIARTT
jgi:putative PIN family toxin of toxin-antitoxin system